MDQTQPSLLSSSKITMKGNVPSVAVTGTNLLQDRLPVPLANPTSSKLLQYRSDPALISPSYPDNGPGADRSRAESTLLKQLIHRAVHTNVCNPSRSARVGLRRQRDDPLTFLGGGACEPTLYAYLDFVISLPSHI